MPDIDLDPHEYADRDPKSGKWRRPQSKRAAKWWFVAAVVFLGVLAFHPAGTPEGFWLTAMIAFFAGIFASNWLRDVY